MNGDISRIPIQSLSAVVSLTDIIPDLPLPAPLQVASSAESLLHDPKLTADALHCLRCGHDQLAGYLSDALGNVCTNNIDFKEGFASDVFNHHHLPDLLSTALLKKTFLFEQKRGFFGLSSQEPAPLTNSVSDSLKTQQNAWYSQNNVSFPNESQSLTNSLDEPIGSPNKKKKKRKKKKHKHRDDGDTSGTGGESSATTPAACGDASPNKLEDCSLSPTPTYGVISVNDDAKKLSLKIVKRPPSEHNTQITASSELTADLPKKEKKKKRSKEKDKDHRSRREKSNSSVPSSPAEAVFAQFPETTSIHSNTASQNSVYCGLNNNLANALVTVLTVGDSNKVPESVGNQNNHLIHGDASNIDLSLISSDGLFDHLESSQNPYTQSHSQSTSSLPNTPVSATVGQKSMPSNHYAPLPACNMDGAPFGNQSFTSEPNLIYELLRNVDPTISLKHSSDCASGASLIGPNATNPISTRSSMGTSCNIMEYASNILQNEMINSSLLCNNLPVGVPSSAACDSTSIQRTTYHPDSQSMAPSFLVGPHLLDSSHVSIPNVTDTNFDVLGGILNSSVYTSAADHNPVAFPTNFDISGLTSDSGTHHVPMGLASYLSTPSQPAALMNNQHECLQSREPCVRMDSSLSTSMTSGSQPWWKRKNNSAIRRRKRRKNELEGLQSWTVNYPNTGPGAAKAGLSDRGKFTDERTWDDAIGSYSQVLGERAKRRKRIARQTGNFDPDYVFEHDKDYPDGGDSDHGSNDAGGVIDLTNDSTGTGDASHPNIREMRTGVANRSYAGMDDDDDDLTGHQPNNLYDSNSNARRRKKPDDDEPFEVRLKEPVEARFPHIRKVESVRRRRERVGFGTVGLNNLKQYGFNDTLINAESGSLKRFLSRLNNILESVEDTDLVKNVDDGPMGDDFQGSKANCDESVPITNKISSLNEVNISPEDLTEFCRDAAKLNATNMANQIPTDRLLNLLTILLINIRDGSNVIATLRPEEEADEHESKLWREVAMERVMRGMNAGLTALLLMTSKEMPREVYVEEVIDRTIHAARFQLFNCIYPEFDPAYRVENAAKENQSSIKSRRARERDAQKPKVIIHLYHKLIEIVSNLAKLVKMQRLTDSLILTLSSMGVSIFFVENISELQLAALDLVTAIFSQYEPHRKLIMEEILASLARLPSSKKNLRSYRLNSEDSIQMLTALSLLLVQSVMSLSLPSNSDQNLTTNRNPSNSLVPNNNNNNNNSTNINNNEDNSLWTEKSDTDVLVINSYHNALRTAHTFLLVFLRKSTMKGEDDYRIIFENFVNDLLLAVNKPEWPAAEVMLSLLGSLLVQQFNNKSLDQSVRVASVDYLGTVASTLRRDAVTSQLKENDIDAVIRDLLDGGRSDDDDDEEDEEEDEDDENSNKKFNTKCENETNIVLNKVKPETDAHHYTDSQPVNLPKCSDENGFYSLSPNSSHKIETVKVDVNSTVMKPVKKAQVRSKNIDPISQLDRVQALRDSILDYLAAEESSPTAVYARKFYLAQWLNDCTKETERAQRAAVQKKNQTTVLNGEIGLTRETELSASDKELVFAISERRRQHILYKIHESPDAWRQRRRLWTLSSLPGFDKSVTSLNPGTPDNGNAPLIFRGTLDYEDCCLVCRYLASLRPFSQSFDVYLSQICKLLSESSVAVRTKALRCLSAVVEADPNVLARVDIERAVHSRLLDTSTSVREAAVDLLGRFLGCRPELTTQYYPMLAERIRDKGVSVRKRVIRILRDICLEQPDFPRVPEICVKMIRRVNDEEGIKKLVNEVFQSMWFTPVRERDTVKLLRKVMNITEVVAACKDTGYEWFEQFLRTLLKKEETEKVKPVEKACKQIVDCLVQNIMRLEEISGQNNQRLVACLATLHLLTKIRPELMVQYTMVLQPYLSIRCNEASDAHVLHYVARILEATVPLMEHPSETLVAQLEEDMVRLTLRHGKMVLESCVACLGAVVNRVSKNYSLARDCFTRFFNALQKFRNELTEDLERKISPTIRPSILRALFTVGLLCKYFDSNVFQSNKDSNIRDQVFDTLMFFTEQVKSDIEMRKKSLSGLGFLCTRHHELLRDPRLHKFYHDLLQENNNNEQSFASSSSSTNNNNNNDKQPDHQLELKCIVLENLLNFFMEEEKRMLDADSKWNARQHQESLKEMGDIASGMASSVAEYYLNDVLESFLSPFFTVRLTALSVINTILHQGLIHPIRTVKYLIAMQTDIDPNIRVKADAQLQDIDQKYPGFLTTQASLGVGLSYRLQCVLYKELREKQKSHSNNPQQLASPESLNASKSNNRRSTRNRHCASNENDLSQCVDQSVSSSEDGSKLAANPDISDSHLVDEVPDDFFGAIRGTRDSRSDMPVALNSNLYSMLRSNKRCRRSLLYGLVAAFEDSQPATLCQLVYIADNLAHFPYQSQEEPLFVIHHIDLMVSMSGSGVLQSVREALFPELKAALEAALASQMEAEAKNRAQLEMQLQMELKTQQAISIEALNCGDHVTSDAYAEQAKQTIQKLNNLTAISQPVTTVGMNELRSVALMGRETFPQLDLGLLDEEEEDPIALYDRLSRSRQTTLPVIRNAIRASRAYVLLLILKQFLKELYSITDTKIQRYSPTDASKLWEKPLTRRSGVRFHPVLCLKAAGAELMKSFNSNPHTGQNSEHEERKRLEGEEEYDGEMQSLIRDYLDFRKLILTIDPPGEDEPGLDDLNVSIQSISQTQNTDRITMPNDQNAIMKTVRPIRTIVPQSHNKSSDEENDSDDSNAGGASRLMLAQSAPPKRRKPALSIRNNPKMHSNKANVKKKRKRRKRFTMANGSSGEETDSADESEPSDPDYKFSP